MPVDSTFIQVGGQNTGGRYADDDSSGVESGALARGIRDI